MNIGILGGTFDPIHLGHLVIAEEARLRLSLAEVIFAPAGQPWLKEDRLISPARHRLEMTRLAIGGNPCFKLSTVEIECPGSSYTVDTIADLRSQLGTEVGLFFILGSDSLVELPLWKDPAHLVQMCDLVAVNRPGGSILDLDSLELVIPGISGRVILLDTPQIGISSTDIRQRVSQR